MYLNFSCHFPYFLSTGILIPASSIQNYPLYFTFLRWFICSLYSLILHIFTMVLWIVTWLIDLGTNIHILANTIHVCSSRSVKPNSDLLFSVHFLLKSWLIYHCVDGSYFLVHSSVDGHPDGYYQQSSNEYNWASVSLVGWRVLWVYVLG